MTNKERLVQNNGLINQAIVKANLLPDNPNAFTSGIRKDVNFYDYDGTLCYSYTVEQAQNLTALPEPPSHEGLTSQGWNYDLATIKSYNSPVDVGALYVTDDGKTRLYIRIASDGRMEVPLYFSQSVANGVSINWGDGNTETFDGTGEQEVFHTYANIGDYVITLSPVDGQLGLGAVWGQNILGFPLDAPDWIVGSTAYNNMVQKIELASGVELGESVFGELQSLKSIVLPNDLATLPGLFDCTSLQALIWPNRSVNGDDTLMWANYNLSSLKLISIPDNVEQISYGGMQEATALISIVIPRSVTSINSNAFANCTSMAYYDFTSHTSVPTLANVNAFEGIPDNCEIRVPAKLHYNWVHATNWLFYCDHIIPVKSHNANSIMFFITDAGVGDRYTSFAFEAEKNMTWRQFINSSYNTANFEIHSNNTIEYDDGYVYNADITFVNPDDLIISNYNYEGGAPF